MGNKQREAGFRKDCRLMISGSQAGLKIRGNGCAFGKMKPDLEVKSIDGIKVTF